MIFVNTEKMKSKLLKALDEIDVDALSLSDLRIYTDILINISTANATTNYMDTLLDSIRKSAEQMWSAPVGAALA